MVETTHQAKALQEFETTTRNLRWIWIAVVLITFPPQVSSILAVYAVLAVAALYNAVRYIPYVMRFWVVRSPLSVLAIDSILVGLIVALVGNISTPYSALLVFVVISAARLYRLQGILLTVGLQSVILYLITVMPLSPPVLLNNERIIIITMFALAGFGVLVEQLTRSDRRERSAIAKLGQESERQRQRLAALVNSLSDAIFVTDSKGIILQHNGAALMLANTSDSLVGKRFNKLITLRPRANMAADPVNILTAGSNAQHRRDLSVILHDYSIVDLDIVVMQVRLADDGAPEYIIICEDITTERSLDEQRSEFISVASHELRTPLAIIEAALATAVAAKNGLSSDVRALVEQAHRNSALLSGIIKDITLLAEAKNDNLPIQLTQIDPATILDGLVKDFTTQAKQKGLRIKSVVKPDAPLVLSTERYIYEILQNYLTNAIKYSQKGTITVSAELAKNGAVLFAVQDHGIGISPKNQKQLFSKFFRAEDYRTRTTGGTGLGLYLCMEIARRMGARVWYRSVLNEGSTFYLEVPVYSQQNRR